MNASDKTIEVLVQELNELKKKNDALKAMCNRDNNPTPEESGLEYPGMKVDTYSDSNSGKLTQQDEQEIRRLFENYIKLYSSRDDRLTTYFSENFSGFTGGGDFLVKDKDEWIAITHQDFNQIKNPIRIEIKDLALQSLSKTIAVTTGFFNIHLPIEDHILSKETARLVLIFRKESEDWKISHSSISIPYHLVQEGEVYPLKELTERNKLLEKLVDEQSGQLSEANDNLLKTNEILARKIADHKDAELALQQSSKILEAVISTSPDGVGIVTLDGKIQLISEKLVEMHGFSDEQSDTFHGINIFDFIDPSDHKKLTENIGKLLAGKRDHNLTEYLAVKKDNSRFHIDVNSTLLHDANGNPESILYVERDITQRKNAELIIQEQNKKLKEINASKDKFFSIISHDLKSPFQGILGLTEMMADSTEEFTTVELVEHCKLLNEVANNLYKLLGNLLKWSQIQNGSINFEPKDIDLSEVIAECIASINQNAVHKGITVVNEVPEMIRVFADENMISTVLRNLLTNAVKFTKTGGKVIVRSEDSYNGTIKVSVLDNGVGIPEKNIERLFKIEEKISTLGTNGESSTGLGLLLCKEFVDKHGGEIHVESRENIGSTFSFTIPGENTVLI